MIVSPEGGQVAGLIMPDHSSHLLGRCKVTGAEAEKW